MGVPLRQLDSSSIKIQLPHFTKQIHELYIFYLLCGTTFLK